MKQEDYDQATAWVKEQLAAATAKGHRQLVDDLMHGLLADPDKQRVFMEQLLGLSVLAKGVNKPDVIVSISNITSFVALLVTIYPQYQAAEVVRKEGRA